MRQSGPQRRGRGRPSGRRGFNNPPNRSYDSNGPEVKIRGTASTVYEKYQALARDATTSGDRVAAENYFQHAEHYYRVLQATKPPQPAGEGDQRGDQRNDQRGDQRDNRGHSQQNDQQNRDVRDNDARDDDASTGADDEVVEVTGEASGSATQAEATHLDEPVVDAADTGAIGVDKDQERAMPMNPAELAAMSESGRGARPTAEPQATEHSTALQDSNGSDNDGETAAPAPRRQPRRRRRPAAEAVAAKADEASAPEPVVEDVEPS
ncbi:MAG: DUF4167 domain-containing protein [Alphaproteobacteria bacterium]